MMERKGRQRECGGLSDKLETWDEIIPQAKKRTKFTAFLLFQKLLWLKGSSKLGASTFPFILKMCTPLVPSIQPRVCTRLARCGAAARSLVASLCSLQLSGGDASRHIPPPGCLLHSLKCYMTNYCQDVCNCQHSAYWCPYITIHNSDYLLLF